jgi:hypothetical protein
LVVSQEVLFLFCMHRKFNSSCSLQKVHEFQ